MLAEKARRQAEEKASQDRSQKNVVDGDASVRAIDILQRRFPKAFPRSPASKVPLQLAILSNLLANAEDLSLSEGDIRAAVATWCREPRYWAALTAGALRRDLAGNLVGIVTETEARRARYWLRKHASPTPKPALTLTPVGILQLRYWISDDW
ncbi:ProQ/FinO family protein [Cupriavidus pauculus]